jgi:hypothetical protein
MKNVLITTLNNLCDLNADIPLSLTDTYSKMVSVTTNNTIIINNPFIGAKNVVSVASNIAIDFNLILNCLIIMLF